MCGAYENHIRLQTISGIKSLLPWNWLDQSKCKLNQDLSCYFNIRHKLCIDTSNTKKKVVIKGFVSAFCPTIIHDLKSCTRWRTATTEYLFGINGLTDVVRIEVKRQIAKVFGSIGNVPKDMITVHIRWNDKRSEMELVSIDESIKNVIGDEVDYSNKEIVSKTLMWGSIYIFLSDKKFSKKEQEIFKKNFGDKNTKSILSLIKISSAKSIQVKIDNILEEASKLLNKDKEKIINELSKLLKVVDGDQKVASSIINKIKTNIKI